MSRGEQLLVLAKEYKASSYDFEAWSKVRLTPRCRDVIYRGARFPPVADMRLEP
jgi:hypothetical protein